MSARLHWTASADCLGGRRCVISVYMRHLRAVVFLAISALPAVAQQSTPPRVTNAVPLPNAMVWGQVRSEKTGAPLRSAVVELVAGGRQISTVTDSFGIYYLRDVPSGRRLLRASHIDHAPNEAEMLVLAGDRHTLDFDLEFRPLRINGVTAQTIRAIAVNSALDTSSATRSELGAAAARVLESTPGVAELGLAEAAGEVPGQPTDPTDVLYVRGGAADLKLVLLNGAPVYAPFHIGGLIHALDADVLRSAVLYMGGAPARYDGGLSYVMDLETRSARNNSPHVKLGLDMMAAQAMVEGPLGSRGSLLAAGRNVHGLGTGTWFGNPFPYSYGDALGRADYRLGANHLVTLTGFWNRERVNLDTLNGVRQAASWGNRAGSLRYRGQVAGNDVLGTVALGMFRTKLPLGGILPLITEGTANRTRVALDFERSLGTTQLHFGGSFDRIDLEYRAYRQDGSRDDAIVGESAAGNVSGVYAEAVISPMPRVRLRGGLRADVFSRDAELRLAPRASATVLLSDRVALTLAAGHYRQYVRAPEQSLVFLGNVVPDSGGGPSLTVAEASHVVLGLSQELGEGVRLGLEGYFKQLEGLHFARAKKTESSGVDLWVRRGTGSVTGWLGYSLAWIWTVEDEGRRFTQSFSGRHMLSAGVAGPVLGGGNFDVRVSYGAGLPYTAIPEPETASPVFGASLKQDPGDLGAVSDGNLPTEPQEPYLRVDAQLQRTFSGRWRGLDFDVTPYVKVINALNRRDAIFYHYNRDIGQAEPIAGLPIVPIFGLEWKF